MLKRGYQLALISIAVLAVFYPANFAPFSSIDDQDMITKLLNLNHWDLKGLFIPHDQGGLYYRPLLYMTFLLDKDLWFLQPSFMHLENVLLHLANTFLVYFIASVLLPESDKKRSFIPLVSALCFALHPIVTEPVDWVSGRTDIVAGFFVLASALALLKYKLEHKKILIVVSAAALLMGMLSKEVALGFLPGAFLLLTAKTKPDLEQASVFSRKRWKLLLKRSLSFVLLTAGTAFVFMQLRSFAYSTNSPKIRTTLRFIFNDLYHAMFVFLGTFGFYMKKIFYPFPLNFTILEVDPLYELLAIPLVAICIFIGFRRSLLSATFLSGIFLIIPVFPIAYNQIAWTPYAERYAYIPAAFIIIGAVRFLGDRFQPQSRLAITVAVPCFLAVMAGATFQRNLVWESNLDLFADTAEKNPGFNKIWNELGLAYYAKKGLPNAERCLTKAATLYSFNYEERHDINLAVILREEGKKEEAARAYERVIAKTKGKSEAGYGDYIELLAERAAAEKDPTKKLGFIKKEIECNEKLYALNGKPISLYRMGKIYFDLGDRQKALEYYRKAYDKFPAADKPLARKRIAELEEE